MDNGFGILVFVGVIILGIAASHEYDKTIGFAIIAIGFIIMGVFGALINYLENRD